MLHRIILINILKFQGHYSTFSYNIIKNLFNFISITVLITSNFHLYAARSKYIYDLNLL